MCVCVRACRLITQLGKGTMPKLFGVCVCVSLLLGVVFYVALNGAQEWPLERTLEYCSFEEAAAVAVPSYCDVGESCYNSTQQLDQVDHEEQVKPHPTAALHCMSSRWLVRCSLHARVKY